VKGKLIFLQHGVIKDNLVGLYQDQTKVDVFICGAKLEYEYVASTFHYKNNEVCYTGLARYDALHSIKFKRQILVMPTWRVYLKTLSKNELLQSTYFCAWNTFLSDERLIRFLEKQNLELVFYPHFEMQPYISHFKVSSERIKVVTFENYDVQTLLKESLLLITDYSSVFFDFGYMQKPCIYYQFDQEEFVKKHYLRGYFDYEQNGFGPVTKDLAELMIAIETVGNHQFQMEECYQKRCEQFFPLKDQNNCERIFQEIEKL
jgi:CDP-glycerol glycerophosphotransferase (TagB/SpsB family)